MIGDVVLDRLMWESLASGGAARLQCWLASEGHHMHEGQPIVRVRLLHPSLDVVDSHDSVLKAILAPKGDRFSQDAMQAQAVPFQRRGYRTPWMPACLVGVQHRQPGTALQLEALGHDLGQPVGLRDGAAFPVHRQEQRYRRFNESGP